MLSSRRTKASTIVIKSVQSNTSRSQCVSKNTYLPRSKGAPAELQIRMIDFERLGTASLLVDQLLKVHEYLDVPLVERAVQTPIARSLWAPWKILGRLTGFAGRPGIWHRTGLFADSKYATRLRCAF